MQTIRWLRILLFVSRAVANGACFLLPVFQRFLDTGSPRGMARVIACPLVGWLFSFHGVDKNNGIPIYLDNTLRVCVSCFSFVCFEQGLKAAEKMRVDALSQLMEKAGLSLQEGADIVADVVNAMVVKYVDGCCGSSVQSFPLVCSRFAFALGCWLLVS